MPCERPHASNPLRALRGQSLEDGPQRELAETTLVVLRALSISDAKATLLALKNNWSAGEVCCVSTGGDYVHVGVIEDVTRVSAAAHQANALVVTATTEAVALGLLKSPGALGVDIAVAEGQSLGIPVSYGGPGLGLFACRERFLRNMPGRLVGETVDHEGRRGFVLTLATREQHIRRERATSNICTNHGLCALAATVFLCLMGKQGLRELAERNARKSHYTRDLLLQTNSCRERFALGDLAYSSSLVKST